MNDFFDRRRGADSLVKTVQVLGALSWIILIPLIMVISWAKPVAIETFFDRLFSVSLRHKWNRDLLSIIPVILLILFIVSVAGIVMNLKRCRRKDDRINRSLLINLLLSIAGASLYFLFIV